MSALVPFTNVDGSAVQVNAEQVAALSAVPSTLLPSGVPDGTYVELVGAEPGRLAVQGTLAATAAALSAVTPSVQAAINAAIAAFAATLASFTMKFAGAFPGLAVGTASRYLPDSAGTVVQMVPLGYSVPACRLWKVRFHCVANAALTDVVVTVYRNNAPTGHTHTFAAGVTGFASSVLDVDFADDDTIDVFATSTNAGAGTVQLVVSPYFRPIKP